MAKKMTFALCFCNRGFMPGELIYGAREDMVKAVTAAGYDYIMMDGFFTISSGAFRNEDSDWHTIYIHGKVYPGVEPPFVRSIA